MKLETFLNRHVHIRKLVRERVPPYIRRDEPGGRGPRPTYKADKRGSGWAAPARKSAGGEPYDLTDLMRYIYDGLLFPRPFPSPTSLPLKETYRRRVPDAADTTAVSFPPAYSYVLLSLSLSLLLSLSLPLKLASPGFPLLPSIRLYFFFHPLRMQSLSLFPRGEWTFRYSFCAGWRWVNKVPLVPLDARRQRNG